MLEYSVTTKDVDVVVFAGCYSALTEQYCQGPDQFPHILKFGLLLLDSISQNIPHITPKGPLLAPLESR